MTDPTHEELDALTIWQPMTTAPRDGTWFIAGTAHGTERVVHFADAHDRFPISHDGEAWATAPIKWTPLCTITALRAQIDRERAATIEAAAKACEAVASNWSCGHMPPHCDCARDVEQWQFAADEVRALHTDATRAAMDAIRREGYEAGVAAERARMSQPRTYTSGSASVQVCPECDIAGCHHIRALAASIPPDPDTTPRK